MSEERGPDEGTSFESTQPESTPPESTPPESTQPLRPPPPSELPDAFDEPSEPAPAPNEPAPYVAPPAEPTERLPRARVVAPDRPLTLHRRRYRTLAAFAQALIPPGGTIDASAHDAGVAIRLDAALASFDPRARKTFSRALQFFEWSSLATRALRPFSRLSQTSRTSFIERALDSRLLRRRLIAETLKRFCLAQWASTSPVERALGFTYACVSHEPARDGAALEVLSFPQISRDHIEDCDVVVIGSGAGGAVIAKELAELGMSVVVIEEGPALSRTDFTGPPFERSLRMVRNHSLTASFGSPPITLPAGMAVGGSTLVGAGTLVRTPDTVLDAWASSFGLDALDDESMRPIFERIEKIQHVKPVPEELLGESARIFRRGVDAIGASSSVVERSIEGCRGCGVCTVGCPSDAKLAMHLTYLPRAQRHGTTIYANARAGQILIEGGRARGVVVAMLDPKTRTPRARLTVRAKTVVVAAGAVHTPALLAANALGNQSGQLGRNLRLQPSITVGAFFPAEVAAWHGTMQPLRVDTWHESHRIWIDVSSQTPAIGAAFMPGAGLRTKEMVAKYRTFASAEIFVADTSSGRVIRRTNAEPIVSYRLNDVDARRLVRGIAHCSEIFLAAGAGAVITGISGVAPITSTTGLAELPEEAIKPRALHPTGMHPVGTARMGSDPAATVTDAWGEVRGIPGLFVADASMLPGCPTVHPQETIMAFATRTAGHIARLASEGE